MHRFKDLWWIAAVIAVYAAVVGPGLFPVCFIVILIIVFNCVTLFSSQLKRKLMNSPAPQESIVGRYRDAVAVLPSSFHFGPFVLVLIVNALLSAGSVFFAWYLVFAHTPSPIPPLELPGIFITEGVAAVPEIVTPTPFAVTAFIMFSVSVLLCAMLASLRQYDANKRG